jgi:hypothetical protein
MGKDQVSSQESRRLTRLLQLLAGPVSARNHTRLASSIELSSLNFRRIGSDSTYNPLMCSVAACG